MAHQAVPGSKARMLLGTAEFYDDQTEACPVCDRRIEDQELKDHLVSLKHVDPKMCTELRTFFGDLCREFSEVLPPPLVALGRATIPQVITSDWSIICRDVLGSVFSQLASEYAPKIRDLCESLDVAPVTEVTLLPEGVDDKFRSAAADLLATVREAYCAVSLLEGGKAVVESIAERVHRIVTAIGEDNAESLYSILSKGKDSAEAVKPLALVKRGLIQAKKTQESIDSACEGLRELEALAAPLDRLKALSKYAESEVRSTFDAIRDATVANLGELYPGHQPD